MNKKSKNMMVESNTIPMNHQAMNASFQCKCHENDKGHRNNSDGHRTMSQHRKQKLMQQKQRAQYTQNHQASFTEEEKVVLSSLFIDSHTKSPFSSTPTKP
eukprot:1019568_1